MGTVCRSKVLFILSGFFEPILLVEYRVVSQPSSMRLEIIKLYFVRPEG
jgi:hypothetical protein